MTSFELPQDTHAGMPYEPSEQHVVASSFSFEQEPARPQVAPIAEAISGGNGAPFSIDADRMKAMTPEESFALAGELVKRNRDAEVEKENAAVRAENEKVGAENAKEAAVIAREMADEEAALEAKFGPKESWPEEAKKKADLHKLGWGLVGAAGLTVAGGLAASEANAMDLGGVVANRLTQGVQIEANRANYKEQTQMQHENQRINLENRIEQGRMRMEQNFQRQEAQKNLQWEKEWNAQTTEQGRTQAKARQDAEWNNFVRSVQTQRSQFEANSNMQRQQLSSNFNMRARQVDSVSNSMQRQSDAQAVGNVINQSIHGVFGR